MSEQQELWHDSFEDALRSTCDAINPKEMARELWPERDPVDGAKVLSRCLDPDRPEKLSAGQIALILQRGREHGCHIAMAYLCQTCGYADPQPVEPEDERAALQREYIEAVKMQQKIVKRLEGLQNAK